MTEFLTLLKERQITHHRTIKEVKVIRTRHTAYGRLLEEALDQCYIERLSQENPCFICGTITSKFCSKCGIHYCSRDCQTMEGAKHNSTCLELSIQEISSNYIVDMCKKSVEVPIMFHDTVNNQRKNIGKNKELKEDEDLLLSARAKRSIENIHRGTNKNQKDFKKKNKEIVGSVERNIQDLGISANQKEKSVGTGYWKDDLQDSMFTVGQKIRVKCISTNKRGYWAIEDRNIEELKKMEIMLSQICKNSPYIEDPGDKLFGMKYNNKWHRCIMGNKSKDKVVIKCVDIGTFFCPKIRKYKELPDFIQEVKPMAFKILTDSNLKVDTDIIDVIVVGILRSGVYKVRACTPEKNNENGENNEEKKSEKQVNSKAPENEKKERMIRGYALRSVVNELNSKSEGLFHTGKIWGLHLLGCLVPDDIEEAKHCYEKTISKFEGTNTFEKIAKIGENVIVKGDNLLKYRGVIESLSENGYKVRLVDFGHTVEVSSVYELPKELDGLMQLACRVTLVNSSGVYDFEPDSLYRFKILEERLDGTWLCEFTKGFNLYEVKALGIVGRVWTKRSPAAHKYVEFENGSRVAIVGVSDNNISITHVDENWNEELKNLNRKLNEMVTHTDVNYETLPEGKLIMAKFKDDDLWYRAEVVSKSISEEGMCKIKFVDYGNYQELLTAELKALPQEVESVPIFVDQVRLMGCNDSFSYEGKQYLQKFMKNRLEFVLTYNSDISNGVLLTDPYGNVINPLAYKKSYDENIPGCLQKQYLSVQCFEEVVLESFIFLYVNESDFMNSGTFWAADGNDKNFKAVITEMPYLLSEYCKENSEHHLPRVGELCIAPFQDGWYRGLATFVHGSLIEVFFIDFGNKDLIHPNLVRKMDQNVAKHPPVALKCILHDFEKASEEEKNRFFQFILDNLNVPLRCKVLLQKAEKNLNYMKFPDLF